MNDLKPDCWHDCKVCHAAKRGRDIPMDKIMDRLDALERRLSFLEQVGQAGNRRVVQGNKW